MPVEHGNFLPPILEASDVCVCQTETDSELLPLYGCQAAPPGSTIWLGRIPAVPSPLTHCVKDTGRGIYLQTKTAHSLVARLKNKKFVGVSLN